MRRALLHCLVLTALLGSATACTAPKVAGSIDGEPVCADFTLGGGVVMKGSVKQPVKVAIHEDADDDPIWERLVFGKRQTEDKSTVFAVADEDEEYLVRWSQCPNQFAPSPVEAAAKTTDRRAGYSCGEAKKYKETKLVVRGGDASSRKLQWEEPPEAGCWTSAAGPSGSATASASASAPEPAPKPPPEPSPDPSTSASAAPSAAPSASAKAPAP